MAIKLYFIESTHLDMDRYFRVNFGPEGFDWVNGEFQLAVSYGTPKLCEKSDFTVDDIVWDQFGLDRAMCP